MIIYVVFIYSTMNIYKTSASSQFLTRIKLIFFHYFIDKRLQKCWSFQPKQHAIYSYHMLFILFFYYNNFPQLFSLIYYLSGTSSPDTLVTNSFWWTGFIMWLKKVFWQPSRRCIIYLYISEICNQQNTDKSNTDILTYRQTEVNTTQEN